MFLKSLIRSRKSLRKSVGNLGVKADMSLRWKSHSNTRSLSSHREIWARQQNSFDSNVLNKKKLRTSNNGYFERGHTQIFMEIKTNTSYSYIYKTRLWIVCNLIKCTVFKSGTQRWQHLRQEWAWEPATPSHARMTSEGKLPKGLSQQRITLRKYF